MNALEYWCLLRSGHISPRSGESRTHVRLRLELAIRECTARYNNEEAHTSDMKLERSKVEGTGGRRLDLDLLTMSFVLDDVDLEQAEAMKGPARSRKVFPAHNYLIHVSF